MEVLKYQLGSAAISNVGFKDINYNSGEIYDSTDWSSAVLSGSVNWNTVTYEENPNGNALRWGTMYNFSFTASASPVVGDIQLGLFKQVVQVHFQWQQIFQWEHPLV